MRLQLQGQRVLLVMRVHEKVEEGEDRRVSLVNSGTRPIQHLGPPASSLVSPLVCFEVPYRVTGDGHHLDGLDEDAKRSNAIQATNVGQMFSPAMTSLRD